MTPAVWHRSDLQNFAHELEGWATRVSAHITRVQARGFVPLATELMELRTLIEHMRESTATFLDATRQPGERTLTAIHLPRRRRKEG